MKFTKNWKWIYHALTIIETATCVTFRSKFNEYSSLYSSLWSFKKTHLIYWKYQYQYIYSNINTEDEQYQWWVQYAMFDNDLSSASQKLYIYIMLKQNWNERCYDLVDDEYNQTSEHYVECFFMKDSFIKKQNE